MTGIRINSIQAVFRQMQIINNKCITILLFLLLFLISPRVSSQNASDYDEIGVFLEVPRVGGGELVSVIKGNEVFLPVADLFEFLKIKNSPSPGLDSVSGFFINPEAVYTISRLDNSIHYHDKIYQLEPGDLIRTETNLYLRAEFFGKVFGLDCSFNFRNLTVVLNSKLELPMIREMRLEQMRRNLNRLGGSVAADTTVARTHPLFKFGMADWSVNTTETINQNADARINLALGSMIAGGEATALLAYNSSGKFDEKQQNYLWRYVNNDFSPLRQVMAGKIPTHSTSSIYGPVLGVELTNTPTTYRRSFGSYTLSDKTEPGWIVELYINNVLVDYVKADASGFYTFQVPLVYGNSTVQLKFYGLWGEERTLEKNINVPFNFLPVKTMEYNVSAGIVEDTLFSRFSRTNINYGLSRNITIGGGLEYLSSVTSAPAMPYLNASLKITNNLMLSGEYTYGVRAKGTLSYKLPSNLQFDLNYSRYNKDQKAISYNYLEERRAVVSMPLIIGKFSSYQRLSVYQVILPASQYTTGEWLFSSSLYGISSNLTTYAYFSGQNKPYMYSNLSLAARLPAGIVFMPQIQYGYTQNRFISLKMRFEKNLKENAFLNLSFEQMFISNLTMAELGFRYDFSFAQTGMSVRQSSRNTSFIQYARGSFVNDSKTKYRSTDNRSNVGRGGISVIPFLDLNANGKKDNGEPKAYGLNLHANGGRIEKNVSDTTIRILGLEPYTSCFIELDVNSFDNITWLLSRKTYSVIVDPNIMKTVEIPVLIAGEADGTVSLNKDGQIRGKGRIVVGIYTMNNKLAGKAIAEDDGYFSYFGLKPGKYTVRIDTGQMKRLGLISTPESIPLTIKGGLNGDIAEGLDFTLGQEQIDTTKIIVHAADSVPAIASVDTLVSSGLNLTKVTGDSIPPSAMAVKTDTLASPLKPETTVATEKQLVKKDTTYMVIHQVTQELVTITEDSYALQLGAFKKKQNAEKFRKQLQNLLGKKAEIVIEGDFYKVRITGLKDQKEVDENIAILRQNGVIELWVISLKAKQQQWVLVNRKDSVSRINETVIEKPVNTFGATTSLQVGAFRQGAKAIELKKRLEAILNKQVDIVPENGFFKVKVSGFSSLVEMETITRSLGLMGAGKSWTLPEKKLRETISLLQPPFPQTETNQAADTMDIAKEAPPAVKPDTLQKATEEIIIPPVVTIADSIQKESAEKIEVPVVVQPDTAQKVAEIKNEIPVIALPDTAQKAAEIKTEIPVIAQPDTTMKLADEIISKPVTEQPDNVKPVIEEKSEESVIPAKPVPAEPMISLQVGLIYKHSEALRAQRKIKSKLKVQVDIVKQWDYYRVIIPGFYTREETYRFYPELVGLGYQKIFMIEKK
jgi:hypothetical protein